ncbi:hypothetical protein G7B40_031530 [Aetokthonos hydrillicola Thurmond2011]|jgi:hypothetical protein|uniref:Uncharacterized protein n=1 Tax=Aetokthonos hydrillicola Thurmond2011 TaxID=2712845 RepID=A0AAP5MD28_9CYAN|nr:hypothetical protein [Aetokthonos hydrillicola]MBO3462861.1 hypothetical protein [Aetokthonos hydrillicola CCALA 1050]MBW4590972.1 hypothetical protein [Aetokthonos hydrillicola CCALA 1050]MDR9899058.1 hypothetical protein [Aetokthonos hydrillicola Thurmond2011]
MDYIFHKERYKDYCIEIVQDDDPLCSRDWDNLGTMVCWHKNFDLGDGLPEKMKKRFKLLESRDGSSDLDLFRKWKALHKNSLVVMPVYLYNHSGLTISTKPFHCPWDSGQVGWIYASHDRIKQELNVETITNEILDSTKEILLKEVETYDQYLRGEVYGYVVKDHKQKLIDSCMNFYGDWESDCLPEARRACDSLEKKQLPLLFLPN